MSILRSGASLTATIRLYQSVLLVLCFGLTFVVFPAVETTVDVQAILVMAAGALAWSVVVLNRTRIFRMHDRWLQYCIGAYLVGCLWQFIVHPNLVTVAGEPLLRLGVPALVACVGCGLALSTLPRWRLMLCMYVSAVALSIGAIIEVLLFGWHRTGGVLLQADILGVYVGVALLLAPTLIRSADQNRRLMVAGMALLLIGLLISGTRVAILLVVALGLLQMVGRPKRQHAKLYLMVLPAIVLALCMIGYYAPRYAPTSLIDSGNYRLALLQTAASASLERPLFGYGPGNVSQALACDRLDASPLQTTCQAGYYFNSSHNIYLDRALAFGWPTAIAFLATIVGGLYVALRKGNKLWVWPGMLVAIYYCTNVTNIELELLLWILLIQAARKDAFRSASAG